jgi:hypothetical protein
MDAQTLGELRLSQAQPETDATDLGGRHRPMLAAD